MTAPTIDTDPNFIAADPCWFRAWREPGAIMVHKAKRFSDHYESFAPVRELVGDRKPVILSAFHDPSLMGGEGRLVAYYL
jgi:hypothetical protein